MLPPSRWNAEIIDGGARPLFKVTPSDCPEKAATCESSSAACKQLLVAVNNQKYSESEKKVSNSITGPGYFGYSDPVVAHFIQSLPNADKCLRFAMMHVCRGWVRPCALVLSYVRQEHLAKAKKRRKQDKSAPTPMDTVPATTTTTTAVMMEVEDNAAEERRGAKGKEVPSEPSSIFERFATRNPVMRRRRAGDADASSKRASSDFKPSEALPTPSKPRSLYSSTSAVQTRPDRGVAPMQGAWYGGGDGLEIDDESSVDEESGEEGSEEKGTT